MKLNIVLHVDRSGKTAKQEYRLTRAEVTWTGLPWAERWQAEEQFDGDRGGTLLRLFSQIELAQRRGDNALEISSSGGDLTKKCQHLLWHCRAREHHYGRRLFGVEGGGNPSDRNQRCMLEELYEVDRSVVRVSSHIELTISGVLNGRPLVLRRDWERLAGEQMPIPLRDPELADELVDLGIQVGMEVTNYLKSLPAGSPDFQRVTDEGIPGKFTYHFDIRANGLACDAMDKWGHARQLIVHQFGEECQHKGQDIRDFLVELHRRGEAVPDILALLDPVDGSQHFLHKRNLWCCAVSFFIRQPDIGSRRSPPKYRLAVSVVVDADQRVFYARELINGRQYSAFWRESPYSHDRPLQCPSNNNRDLSDAEICSVFRRPAHYKDLTAIGFPEAAGLNSFGGVPVAAAIAAPDGYDAVFQVHRTPASASRLYDWLAGIHVASASNAVVLSLNGKRFDVAKVANRCVNTGDDDTCGYVVARSRRLAKQIVDSLKVKQSHGNRSQARKGSRR